MLLCAIINTECPCKSWIFIRFMTGNLTRVSCTQMTSLIIFEYQIDIFRDLGASNSRHWRASSEPNAVATTAGGGMRSDGLVAEVLDALCGQRRRRHLVFRVARVCEPPRGRLMAELITPAGLAICSALHLACQSPFDFAKTIPVSADRKSTRLNSSH